IFGKDIKMLELVSEQIKNRIRYIKGVSDISSSIEKGKPELVLRIDREKANRLGLSVYQIAQEVQTAVKGRIATRVHWEGEEIDLRVQLSEKDRQTIKDIESLSISTRFSTIPLREVAKLTYETGPIKLNRENQKRVVSVSANVTGRNIGKVMDEIKRELDRVKFPEGYFVKYGGEAEQMTETFRDLGLIFLLAIVLIYMVMAAEFESFVHPFVIMFTVPFSIIGVLLGLLVSGKAISLPAGMGMLILSGVIVNNGIVLVDYINQLRHKGKEIHQAIVEAGLTRLRPVLMTAITTILGMLPMAFSKQEGAEVRSVVAVVMIGGLIVGTFLTLLVLPVIYIIIDSYSSKLALKLKFLIRREK
ncbi:MAG: efflux RND transporter permease subunit, partial [Endomicrobiia bacterium]